MKTATGFIVHIRAGLFSDRIISLKPTVDGAVRDGLRWYRHACAMPRMQPEIKAEPTQVLR